MAKTRTAAADADLTRAGSSRMRENISDRRRDDERLTEDEIARRKLGPRGVPGAPDTATMTPQRRKKLPEVGDFDGHTA